MSNIRDVEKEISQQIGVLIPPFIKLEYNRPDREIRETVSIDVELVPEIFDLWKKGIRTTGCCSGHGKLEHAYIGVVDEDIPKMIELGYSEYKHPDPTRKDNFTPKTTKESRTALQVIADFLSSHPSKQFKVTGDENCRALVVEKI